jgi:outer membrane protein assembly factor BamB
MSTTAAASQSGVRFRFAGLVLVLTALALAFVWLWPGEAFDEVQRRFATWVVALGTLAGLTLWLLRYSGLSWGVRLAVLVLVPALWFGLVEEFQVSGNGAFLPSLRLRGQASNDMRLEDHRHNQAAAEGVVELAEDVHAFPEYRGRKRDGVVIGPALNRDWNAKPPQLVWKQPVGGGYAAFAIAGNLAVTIEQRRDEEAVVGYDPATGRERWRYTYDAHFEEALGGPGPRATPTIAGGDVYSVGAIGHLVCLEAATGKKKWSVEILKDNDNVMWAMSGSPLVYDEVVVVNPGAQRDTAKGRAVVAYDRKTGKQVWAAGDASAGYSSPMLATFGGKRQVLLLDGTGFSGYDAATGTELWRFPWETYQNINVAQPIVLDGQRVIISAGYNHGSALLKIEEKDGQWSATQVWMNQKLRCKFTSPVLYQGHLYGLDEGILACIDAETGERKWRDGRYGNGQLLLSGDLLVVITEDGKLALVQATPTRFTELGKIPVLKGAKTWNLPALVDGKVYIRNEQEMACYDLR